MSLDDSDRDERTIYVGNLSEKTTQDLLGELFLQAGPLERVSIPKEKDGKNKTFGFVTYKHLVAIPYALNIFSGTKLFGRELMLKNRNTSSSRNAFSNPSTPSSSLTSPLPLNPLLNAISDQGMVPTMNMMMLPAMNSEQQHYINQSQLLMQMASAMQLYTHNNNSEPAFPSTRADQAGSQRERDLVDRNRYHRNDEDRSNRNKPYNRRSRSRSPPTYGNRSRSPNNNNNNSNNNNNGNNNRRDREKRRDDRGYHRWNYRK